ncbi:hypothetical protein BHE74_00035666 [Ensete ventricosum]|nr:hypothetical protein GW17_00039354 [Ensete ventricosum]RWW57537.1 hypothetical protein BHE74_00035666 [Ensete ventricosum]
MERHDPALTSPRVHVLDLCPRKASCLRSMFHLLCRFLPCSLNNLPSYTQVAPLHGPRAYHSTGQPSVESDFHISPTYAFVWYCHESLPHLIS